jgi:GR25 family glycosyltransferase involved in LPS biosynthesis
MYTTGSLPIKKSLPKPQLEVQRMHITALKRGIDTNSKWILILEDDAIPTEDAFDLVNKIAESFKPINTWINLNSGALLLRTKSEKIDSFGLFRIKPSATRCTVAYLISRDLALKFVEDATKFGVPNYLPIDFYFQVLLRKYKAISFWTEPELFLQGSEIGSYDSGFSRFRSA